MEKESVIVVISYYATAASFVFASGTWWFDWNRKRKIKGTIKSLLQTELRTIYSTVREEIIQYDEVVKSGNYVFNSKYYDIQILKKILVNDEYLMLFTKKEEVLLLFGINTLIELINKDNEKLKNKIQTDFYFEKRLVELRNRLIELSQKCGFVDFSIMPIKIIDDASIVELDVYKRVQRQEELVVSIIGKYLPDKFIRQVKEQYFG